LKSSNYSEMYKLVEKAKRYRNQGFYSKELEIYKEIHNDFLPNSSSLYKRPAVLYEKEKKYKEAYDLCITAIELINNDKISGTTESFEKMAQILEKKLNDKKPITLKKKNLLPKIGIGGIIFLILFSSLAYYLSIKENAYDNIQIDLSEMKKLAPAENIDETPNSYPITNDMIVKAKKNITSNSSVKESAILYDNSSIAFGILVNEGTSYSESKKLCEGFVKELGKIACAKYNLKNPAINYFGEIYDYYSIYISIGTSNNESDLILKAYKIKGADEIKYKQN